MCSGWQYGQERESNNVTLSSCASRKDLCTFGIRDNEVVPFFFDKIINKIFQFILIHIMTYFFTLSIFHWITVVGIFYNILFLLCTMWLTRLCRYLLLPLLLAARKVPSTFTLPCCPHESLNKKSNLEVNTHTGLPALSEHTGLLTNVYILFSATFFIISNLKSLLLS